MATSGWVATTCILTWGVCFGGQGVVWAGWSEQRPPPADQGTCQMALISDTKSSCLRISCAAVPHGHSPSYSPKYSAHLHVIRNPFRTCRDRRGGDGCCWDCC